MRADTPAKPDSRLPPDASPDPGSPPPAAEIRSVAEILRVLVKAQKAQRLYDGKNAIAQRLARELYERLDAHLSEHGEITLVVSEFQLAFQAAKVYESENRNDSLAFLLYRDGIRRLGFHPGLEPSEIDAFVSCLNRVALLAGEQDDLVTLFWEQDFDAIRYLAVEELETAADYPKLSEQLASGELAGGDAAGGGAEKVTLELEQPVSTIPVEACRLDDEEIELLREELAAEERLSFPHLVGEVAIELALLEDDDDRRDEIANGLRDIADSFIERGELEDVVGLQEHLDGLHRMLFPKEPRVGALAQEFNRALSDAERLERFLTGVEQLSRPKPPMVTAYLARLDSACLPALVPWMGRFRSPAYRRAVTSAVAGSKDGGLDALTSRLALALAPRGSDEAARLEYRQYVRELLHALSHHPGERALPPLEKLLESTVAETRREAFLALSRYPEKRVDALALDRLVDADSDLRTAALDTLVRRGRGELGPAILARADGAPSVDLWSLNEKRRLFAAIAKLSGEDALEPISGKLRRTDAGWFASKRERDNVEALVHGLRMIGTARARSLLEELSHSAPRVTRVACARELQAMGPPAAPGAAPPASGSALA